MSAVPSQQEQKSKVESGAEKIETSREALTEQLYARLEATNTRVTVERTTQYGWIDARPQLTDEVVAESETEAALEATGKVHNGDFVGAAQDVRTRVGQSRVDAEKFEKDADVFVEFLRKFVGRVRDKMLTVTGGLDTSFIDNGAGIGKAIDESRAFLVAPGTQQEIQDLFTTIYETHFRGAEGDVNYGKQSIETPAPTNLLDDKMGFTLPIKQPGRETVYLYFLYGKVEEKQGGGSIDDSKDEDDMEPANNNNYPEAEEEKKEEQLAA